ncbi:PHP domain-containing protein [Acetivibrio straminisolvens]|jgi:DNA polymerase (family 10)/histidinol-phosphatase (PHP family)|nr:PHP domain-containing protein [Acetivibrio straminisolvens]
MDLHNHTIWSDGADTPEEIIMNAIEHQVEAVGVSDHFDNYSLGNDNLKIYMNHINVLKSEHINSIKVFTGIEISFVYLLKNYSTLPYKLLNQLDFILIEHLDYIPQSVKLEYVAEILKLIKCSKGLAHTDLLKWADNYKDKGGLDYVLDFIEQSNLFWEINTDSAYDIFLNILNPRRMDENTEAVLQGIAKRKIHVSVGSDTHSLVQYNYERLKTANEVAKKLNVGIGNRWC